MRDRFDAKVPPPTVRIQLSNTVQNVDEGLAEFAQRVQKHVSEGYPGTGVEEREKYAVEYFLQGCRDKEASLTVKNREPTSLSNAILQVRTVVHNRTAIMGKKEKDDDSVLRQVKSPGHFPSRQESKPVESSGDDSLNPKLQEYVERLVEARLQGQGPQSASTPYQSAATSYQSAATHYQSPNRYRGVWD